MSIIGHAIQNAIANIQAALKQQSAGQAAQSDEEARRSARVEREEQAAREAVRETREAHENRIGKPGGDERRGARGRSGPKDAETASGDEGEGESEADERRVPGANIDLFA